MEPKRSRATVRELAERFLREYVDVYLKDGTAVNYRHCINAVIVPALGAREFDTVTRRDAQTLHASLRATPCTADYVLSVLGSFYTRILIDWEMSEMRNPTHAIKRGSRSSFRATERKPDGRATCDATHIFVPQQDAGWCRVPKQEDRRRGFDMLNLILLSTLTLTASPTHAVAAQPTPCSIWLDRIEAAAVARGFALDRSKGGFSGHSARGTRLSVVCRTDHASVRISDANGTSAALELTGDEGTGRHSFEVTGDFPGIGSITHTHDFEATKAGVRGFSSYAAAAGDEMAVVESSLGQAKLATSGDSEAVNKRFRSALAASDAWRNAQALGFAAAGLLEKLEKTPGPAANTALDAMSTFAVPPADPLYGSKGNAIVACTTSLAVCAVTVFFPIVVSGCVTSSAACLAATACHAASCND